MFWYSCLVTSTQNQGKSLLQPQQCVENNAASRMFPPGTPHPGLWRTFLFSSVMTRLASHPKSPKIRSEMSPIQTQLKRNPVLESALYLSGINYNIISQGKLSYGAVLTSLFPPGLGLPDHMKLKQTNKQR